SLLGVEVEYHSNALGFFERMRQLEQTSDRVFAHFEPISMLLTSDSYLGHLRAMLLEATPHMAGAALKENEIDGMMRIFAERKKSFEKQRPHVLSFIGLR